MFLEHQETTFPADTVWGQKTYKSPFGVEVELEAHDPIPLELSVSGWARHEEGSLRNGGVEFVTTGAVTMNVLRGRLETMVETLAQNRVRLNYDSYRTSTHIHFNIQNEPLKLLVGMMAVFTIVEPLMMRLIGKNRDGSHFCLPNYDAGDIYSWANRLIHFVSNGGRHHGLERGKYASLNYTRVQDLGTVEFRCFPMSVDPNEVCTWAGWIEAIAGLARTSTDPSYRRYIKEAQQQPIAFAQKVFGYRIDLSDDLTRKLIMLGCEAAYEISRAIKQTIISDEKEAAERLKAKPAKKKPSYNIDEMAFNPTFE